MMLRKAIDVILVATGAEYVAVCRGLKKSKVKSIDVLSIPIGVKPLTAYLNSATLQEKTVLLLGLAGSINPKYQLGNVVIYGECCYQFSSNQLIRQECDRPLTESIQNKLSQDADLVTGLTCDRLIHTVSAKKEKRELTHTDVVDMESFPVIERFPRVAIVRVISDNYEQNLPDLNLAIDSQGNLNKISLAIAMCQQPIAGIKLIHSSLKALKFLEQITYQIFI